MDKRVKESLAEVQMEGYEDRYPREMSGGQQQRIALARMLAYRPKVFLMDEPLSNLDARLRMDMRAELKRLHHVAKATTIYVTHDQVEALTMSSHIAVMKEGVLQQLDTPDRVYHYPANLFVADFIGNPKVNLLDGVVNGNAVDLGQFQIGMDTSGAPRESGGCRAARGCRHLHRTYPGLGRVHGLFRLALGSRFDHHCRSWERWRSPSGSWASAPSTWTTRSG